MKKSLLILAFLTLTGCGDNDHIRHIKAGKNATLAEVSNISGLICNDGKSAPCATVVLNHGKSKPSYPLTSLSPVALIYVYDPSFLNDTQAPFKERYNCDVYPEQRQVVERFCLTVEEANKLLKPFYSK